MAVARMNLGKRFGKVFRGGRARARKGAQGRARARKRNAHFALAYAFAKQQLNMRDGEVESRQHEW